MNPPFQHAPLPPLNFVAPAATIARGVQGRTAPRLPSITTPRLACVLLICLATTNLPAQQFRDPASQRPTRSASTLPKVGTPPKTGVLRKAGVLQKLERFQASVKQRLQTALGVEPDAPDEAGQQRNRDPMAQGRHADHAQTVTRGRQNEAAELSRLMRSGWDSPQRQTLGGATPPPAIVDAAEAERKPASWESAASYDHPHKDFVKNAHRAVVFQAPLTEMPQHEMPQHEMPQHEMPQHDGPRSRPLPPTIDDTPINATPPRWTAASAGDGAAEVWQRPPAATPASGGLPPAARGSILGDSPVTATEHALRLLEENDDLKAKLAVLQAENARLKQGLTETQNLLSRSTTAIDQAKQEMDALVSENRQLSDKLRDAEIRHNRSLMETDRMLQSIREELDDVLVRELSTTGN